MTASLDHGQDLFRVIYSSRALIPETRGFEPLVDEVIRVSEPNNARIDVTGLLLAHNGWFLQVIEGPRRRVSTLFGVIARDLRHNQVELLTANDAEARLFGRWSMCARGLSPVAEPVLQALDVGRGVDPSRLSADKALSLLSAIARLDEA